LHWWVTDYIDNGLHVVLISHIFWVIFSITLHELTHGWAAIWQGDDTPRRLGHMNMNPLVHMGPMSLVMFGLVGIAWGLMPVDPGRFRWKRRGWIVVAAAGPFMNLLLAIVSAILLALWIKLGPSHLPVYDHLITFLFVGGLLNVGLMLFNLLPVPPLDGSAILSGISSRWYRLMHQTNAPMIGMFVVLALMMSGTTSVIWIAGFRATIFMADGMGAAFGNRPVHELLSFGY
jgi:Zn-dependent protease